MLHRSGEERGGYDRDDVPALLRHLERWLVKKRKEVRKDAARRARNGEPEDEFKTGAGYAIVTTYER